MTEFDERSVEFEVRRMQAYVFVLVMLNTLGWLTVLYLAYLGGCL